MRCGSRTRASWARGVLWGLRVIFLVYRLDSLGYLLQSIFRVGVPVLFLLLRGLSCRGASIAEGYHKCLVFSQSLPPPIGWLVHCLVTTVAKHCNPRKSFSVRTRHDLPGVSTKHQPRFSINCTVLLESFWESPCRASYVCFDLCYVVYIILRCNSEPANVSMCVAHCVPGVVYSIPLFNCNITLSATRFLAYHAQTFSHHSPDLFLQNTMSWRLSLFPSRYSSQRKRSTPTGCTEHTPARYSPRPTLYPLSSKTRVLGLQTRPPPPSS